MTLRIEKLELTVGACDVGENTHIIFHKPIKGQSAYQPRLWLPLSIHARQGDRAIMYNIKEDVHEMSHRDYTALELYRKKELVIRLLGKDMEILSKVKKYHSR